MERWVEEIEGWDGRSFSGGYAGLHDLADDSFSGAVSAGSTWLLFVNGRVVSVGEYRGTAAGDEFEPGEPGVDGDIERFEDADGTAYEAPHPAVPLLVAMESADGESRGSYYTEDTPISEVRETLSEGGFTGYVELSENVLSGDYYTVYQAGRSMDLAFVGNARRLKTDEEALELMRDEVGIYEVVAVDLDVTDIPEPAGSSAAGATGGAVAGLGENGTPAPDDGDGGLEDGSGIEAPDSLGDDNGPDPADPEAGDSATEDSATDDAVATASFDAVDGDDTADVEGSDTTPAPAEADGEDVGFESEADAGAEETTGAVHDGQEPTPAVSRIEDGVEPTAESDASGEDEDALEDEPDTSSAGPASGDGSESEQRGADASPTERVASRSVPSLDPERTEVADAARTAGERREDADRTDDGAEVDASDPTEVDEGHETRRAPQRAVEAERAEIEEQLAEVEAELERITAERNELIDERDELEAEVDRLRARVAELEGKVDLPGDGPSLSVAEALSGTNLFVRYESKGKTTVEDVHDGDGSPEDLHANLHIPAHTQFESEDASVAGEPFDQWLQGTKRYQFVEWLVSQLVFEIRDTGSADSMRDLYDALPRIDRIEFDTAMPAGGDEGSEEVTFDVVCRDRMGEPLVVATLDASREPVEEAEMAELVKNAVSVCRTEDSFAAAFYVTAAFFESPALETADDATSRSLLSRDSRRSYVKESRKRGFHLGLVESRNGSFHLSVPEL
jgi:hypothetical protein